MVSQTAQGVAAEASLIETVQREREAHPLAPRLREIAELFVHGVIGLLFPHFAPAQPHCAGAQDIVAELAALRALLAQALDAPGQLAVERDAIADRFVAGLP